MKLIETLLKPFIAICLFTIPVWKEATAQVCSNPGGIIYGLKDDGGIYPINTTNASVGARINPAYTGNAPASANAMGYNTATKKFYYFKRNADQAPQEFVSFDATTNTYAALTSCPTTNNIKTGCVNYTNQGYYCIDAAANLYYYKFSNDKWKLITSAYINQWGANVTATLVAHSSGDIAMDGFGVLWFLCSDAATYGLYKFPANLPTNNTVASLTISQKVAPTTPTPNGSSFAGIAFSPTGQIYMSQYGDDRLYRLNNNLTLTLLGTFTTTAVGTDLTSCNVPMVALATNWQEFSVGAKGDDQALVSWIAADQNIKGYFVEYSTDAVQWKTLSFVESHGNGNEYGKYSFTNTIVSSGRQYYRIRQVGMDGQYTYSEIKYIDVKINNLISITPNPTRGSIQVNNSMNAYSRISILDLAGRVLKESSLNKGFNSIALTAYPPGTYLIRMQSETGQTHYQKIIKE